MITNQTYGNFGTESRGGEYLTLSFSPLSAPLRSRWRNNGLSADFLGEYMTTFLPGADDVAAARSSKDNIRHGVIFVANELLENAMKYHEREVDVPITLNLLLTGDAVTVSASNCVGAAQAEHYKAFVEGLLADLRERDPGDLILHQQEESAEETGPVTSCLGLLTMIGDYGAELGWRFEGHEKTNVTVVTTSAVLPLKTPPGVSA